MSTKNLMAMFGAMAFLRRVDQEEPLVLLYARIGYLAYVIFTTLMYVMLHFRITSARDSTIINIPVAPKAPSLADAWSNMKEAAEKAEAEAETEERRKNSISTEETATTEAASSSAVAKRPASSTEVTDDSDKKNDEAATDDKEEEPEEVISIMEYDLRQLANARRSWVTSTLFLAAVHYHMESVNPLVMSCVMGIIRMMSDDPLVQIHLRAVPAVGKLARPFTPEKNPLATMLSEMAPKDDKPKEDTPAQAEEDLHDDGDDDDDDAGPATVVDQKDDHIKSDFDDENTAGASNADKKTQ